MEYHMSFVFILDVDGVMTTGQFFYSTEGKAMKVFGPHDADGLRILSAYLDIEFITADKRGFEISKRRIVEDMGYKLTYVSEKERYEFIQRSFGFDKLFYMGDGYFDAPILKEAFLGIAPANARKEALSVAKYITPSKSAEGAVMDACLHIKERYFDRV